MKTKFAIGCFVQWYEFKIIDEYIQSVKEAVLNFKNGKNIIVDICFNMAQNLEVIDESEISLKDIFKKFIKIRDELWTFGINAEVSFYPSNDGSWNNKSLKPFTIADYRREFNYKYCEEVDILVWGETDALMPKQTFNILDMLHQQVKDETPKYLATFGINKMWDDSWKVIEHPDFTDKPFIPADTKNWWSIPYTMNIDEMNKFNDKVEDLDIITVNPHKFNGCGLVISSEVIKAGVNIPKSAFFINEDTSFMLMTQKVLGNIPQYHFRNILIVHNRKHPQKRSCILDENDVNYIDDKRNINDWYVKANEYSKINNQNLFNSKFKFYTWEDVWKNIK